MMGNNKKLTSDNIVMKLKKEKGTKRIKKGS